MKESNEIITIDLKNSKISEIAGIVFQIQGALPTKELWDKTKQEAIKYIEEHEGFPATFKMPCKSAVKFLKSKEIADLSIEDIPCPCGNPKHWLIKFKSFRTEI